MPEDSGINYLKYKKKTVSLDFYRQIKHSIKVEAK